MPKHGHMRHGSLQYYPRKRAKKLMPRVNWNSIKNNKPISGFIAYKVGMASAYVQDNTPNSMTKGQRITLPVTILECPSMKILSIRFYNKNKLIKEVLNPVLDKEIKKKIKFPKESKNKINDFLKNNEGKFDSIRAIFYSQVKKTDIKKTPDFIEIALSGNLNQQIEFAKENLNKELSLNEFIDEDFLKTGLIDIKGITKGKGTQGPIKRFGISLKFHKTEKGVRGPGSGGPWHPARVEYTHPMAGQMGFQKRLKINNKIILTNNISEKNINLKKGFKKYGKIKTDYIILQGSVQGPSKRQLIIIPSTRPTKFQTKKNYEFLEIR